MEQAIIINRPEDFKYWSPKFQRIYCGHEFCIRLLPTKKDLDLIVKFVKNKKLNFTFLTPQVDSQGLETIKKIVNRLVQEQLLDEAVINDYGVYYYLRREFPSCEVVLGRMLAWLAPLFSNNFFEKSGIKRLEFDNLKTITIIQKRDIFTDYSYYFPYSLIFNTRYCPVAGIAYNKSSNPGIVKCVKECLQIGELKAHNPALIQAAVFRGNAGFLKTKPDLKALKLAPKINRLVFQPRPPV